MKSLAATPLLLIALAAPALAQTAEPKSVKTIPIRPAVPQPATSAPVKPAAPQTPAETAKAMQQSERMALQSDLAWVGVYNGVINGEVSERMINAIKAFQKDQNAKQTGVLNPQERQILAAAARKLQNDVGWKIALDPINGIRLGIPTKLAPQMSSIGNATGSKWTSAQGQIQIETWRLRDTDQTIAAVAEQQKKEPVGRKIDYSLVRPDFFVLSGLQGLKKFYVRGQIKGSEVRGMTILYDQATEGTMAPVVIAMSSAFTPFPVTPGQADAPPPRKKVEYATGIVVSNDGTIITDRQAVDGCQFIVVPGHGNADRIAEDKTRDLALLRIYGARDLKPIAIGGTAKPNVVLTGIADPQNQGGGAAVTTAGATLSGASLSPAPAMGFTGAAAVDGDGTFAGIALLKPAVVASASGAQGGNDAALVPADQVLAFLKANHVTPVSDQKADAKAAVLRVVCVRK